MKNLNRLNHFRNDIFDARTFRLRASGKAKIRFENVDQNAAQTFANILKAVIQVGAQVI